LSYKIGLISDVHASSKPVSQALSIFKKKKVDSILCLGDIAGYGDELEETVQLLKEHNCKSIMGNHESWYMDNNDDKNDECYQYFSDLPKTINISIEGKELFCVHASPPDDDMNGIRLLDEHGNLIPEEEKKWKAQLTEFEFDVLLIGHTHQVINQRLGDKLVINPGSTKFNHSCMILKLPEMSVEIISLSNKNIIYSWNWSLLYNKNIISKY